MLSITNVEATILHNNQDYTVKGLDSISIELNSSIRTLKLSRANSESAGMVINKNPEVPDVISLNFGILEKDTLNFLEKLFRQQVKDYSTCEVNILCTDGPYKNQVIKCKGCVMKNRPLQAQIGLADDAMVKVAFDVRTIELK